MGGRGRRVYTRPMHDFDALSQDQQMRIARTVRDLQKRKRPRGQKGMASAIASALGTQVATDSVRLSRFLGGDPAAVSFYFDATRRDEVFGAIEEFLEINRAVLLKMAGIGSGYADGFHPAWPEIAVTGEEDFVVDVPGVRDLDHVIRQVKALKPGQTLWLVGGNGIGKTTLLARLARRGVGVLVAAPDSVPEGDLWLIDEPTDPQVWLPRLAERGARAVIAVQERPRPGSLDARRYDGSRSDSEIRLGPWDLKAAFRYLDRLEAVAGRGSVAPKLPSTLREWLRDRVPAELPSTPGELGYIARHAAEKPDRLEGPDSRELRVAAWLDAASRGLVLEAARELFDRHGRRAYALAAAEAVRRDAPGALFRGTKREDVRAALVEMSGLHLGSIEGRSRLRALLAQATRKTRDEATALANSPTSDDLLDLLVSTGLWVEHGAGLLRPADPSMAERMAAEVLADAPDGWSVLLATLQDRSRDGVRRAAAARLKGAPERIEALLCEDAGRIVPAVEFAAALAASAPEEARPEQVVQIVASVLCLGGPTVLNEAGIVGTIEHAEAALRAVSRRYRGALPRLHSDADVRDLLRSAVPAVRSLLTLAGLIGAELDHQLHRWGGLRGWGFETPVKALAGALPWQATLADVFAARRGDVARVLLDRVEDGDIDARSIASGGFDGNDDDQLWQSLPVGKRLPLLGNAPTTAAEHLELLDRCIRAVEKLPERERPANEVLARDAIARWIARFGDVPEHMTGPFVPRLSKLWLEGLRDCGASKILGAEFERLVHESALAEADEQERVARGLWNPNPQSYDDVIEVGRVLYTLGEPEPLRCLVLGARDERDERALAAAQRLITLRDDATLRELVDEDAEEPSHASVACFRALAEVKDEDIVLWSAENLAFLRHVGDVLERITQPSVATLATRWSVDSTHPRRAERAAHALLRAGLGGVREVGSLFAGPHALWHCESGLRHPDKAVQRRAADVLGSLLLAAGAFSELDGGTFARLLPTTPQPVRSVWDLTAAVRALHHHKRSESAKAIFTLARAAGAHDPKPTPEQGGTDWLFVDELIETCAATLLAFRDHRFVDLLRSPLGRDGDEARQSRLRSNILLKVGYDAVDLKVLEEIALDDEFFRRVAARRRLEDEPPPVKTLVAEWCKSLPELVAGAEPHTGWGAVSDAPMSPRWATVHGYLARREPHALAAAWVAFARDVKPEMRGRALVFYGEVVSLDAEAGPEFLRALMVPKRSSEQRPTAAVGRAQSRPSTPTSSGGSALIPDIREDTTSSRINRKRPKMGKGGGGGGGGRGGGGGPSGGGKGGGGPSSGGGKGGGGGPSGGGKGGGGPGGWPSGTGNPSGGGRGNAPSGPSK